MNLKKEIYILMVKILKIYLFESLRKQLGVVLQDTFLFSGNVADNLRLDSSIDNQRLKEICSELGLDNLLRKLPNGLDTYIRERGGNLSSGERQLYLLQELL